MKRVSLNGTWNLTYGPQPLAGPAEAPDSGWPAIPATVPGNVELDLMAAGELDDPSVGNRVYDLRKYETYEWWYSRTFPTPDFDKGRSVELVFEGLDCLGTIWLNGERIGDTDNMFITHRFDVTDRLRSDGDNELVVRIASAVLEGRRHEAEPYEYAHGAWFFESLAIRKAPHMFGWDIMPRMVSAGLWRDVSLEVLEPTRWRSVYWTTTDTDPLDRTATVFVEWDFVTERRGIDSLQVRITLSRDGKAVHTSEYPVVTTRSRATIELADVDLWWPRGYGKPALYDANVELIDEDGRVLDNHSSRIGLRTVELRRTEVSTLDEPGEFVFIVNRQKVFVKGTNWVPLDAYHARDAALLDDVFAMAVDLNCNMIRCWGGNVYEDHAFFDLCDENGVMVWQDFAFACHVYPQTDEFAARVRAEAEAVVKKLRNHPSLALWAGNNEVDNAFTWDGSLGLDPNTERLSREILPQVVLRLDPIRHYLPSSPYRGPEVYRRGNSRDLMPEVHLWSPGRLYYKDPFYTRRPAHFVSEIGYHGCPVRESLEQFLDPDHLWPWQDADGVTDDQWLTKAVRPHPTHTHTNERISYMAESIRQLFGNVPKELDEFILASQIAQAEAKKFFVEWWRQGKWRRTGILWWNLRDGWPIFSDAVVDYYNRKKLAYWYLKRSQVDVCAICAEPVDGRHPILVVNDTLKDVSGSVTVRDADSDEVLLESDYEVADNEKTVVDHLPHPEAQAMWLIEWTVRDQKCYNHYLVGTPPFRLEDYSKWLVKLGLPDDALRQLRPD
jgi:beta-mannosidase